jgi:hypothetical protein
MCTVTFVPAGGTVYITSNRDEKSTRLPAEPPRLHSILQGSLLFPKDGNKGGTWIAVSQKGDAGVLLNGAAVPHETIPFYRLSRGLILPHILTAAEPVEAFSKFEAAGVAPFTLVLYVQKQLYECRWDGKSKSVHRLLTNQPHIWSSSTLYTPEMMEKRKQWFDQWRAQNRFPNSESVYRLHRFGGENDPGVDYVMNRKNEILTVSITALQLQGSKAVMTYHQLATSKTYRSQLHFYGSGRNFQKYWLRRLAIRLRYWEYWPFSVVYAPIFLYWFWLCLKARSLFFFNAANPTIRYGGFLMESKKEIYNLLPEGSYPATALVKKEDFDLKETEVFLHQHHLYFPLIAKPDIGLRGLGVQLLHTMPNLAAYHQKSKVDYLLQAYVPYKNELGIFYCRMPGSSKGQITGVVGKELVVVKGDGFHTVEELVAKENRYLLQLETLAKADPLMLTLVLADGEEKVLVPYGNHSRGAKFIDLTSQVTERLTHTINQLCLNIPGFYFGRLDIRYNRWDELCNGKNFSVIELNGAGSEPAHIYDPRHSIFYGWKEIVRHLDILYHISRQNKKQGKASYLAFKEGIHLFRENANYIRKIS